MLRETIAVLRRTGHAAGHLFEHLPAAKAHHDRQLLIEAEVDRLLQLHQQRLQQLDEEFTYLRDCERRHPLE